MCDSFLCQLMSTKKIRAVAELHWSRFTEKPRLDKISLMTGVWPQHNLRTHLQAYKWQQDLVLYPKQPDPCRTHLMRNSWFSYQRYQLLHQQLWNLELVTVELVDVHGNAQANRTTWALHDLCKCVVRVVQRCTHAHMLRRLHTTHSVLSSFQFAICTRTIIGDQ